MKLFLFFIFIPVFALGQNTIGLPDVINYNKLAYNAGQQNWDIKQDGKGIVYFANNEGLLIFDGSNWQLQPLPNKTILRSIEIGNDQKIYVGGQDELGFFYPDKHGNLKYNSIINLIPENDRAFGDVWNIISFENSLFFRTSFKIFELKDGIITTFNASKEWLFLTKCNNKIYAQDKALGLMTYENSVFSPLLNANNNNITITGVLPTANTGILVTTLKDGIFELLVNRLQPIKNINNTKFINDRIYASTIVNNNSIALATTNNGVYIIDQTGNIIQSIAKTEGLQNKNVLSVFTDKQGNIWLGLDNGIDLITYNNAIKHINPFLQDGSGYTAIVHNNNLFIGTSIGLYSTQLQPALDFSFSKGVFNAVNNTKGQTWSLSKINNKLILGHHEGAFEVDNNTATPIENTTGYWNFTPFNANISTTKSIAGTYNGISIFNATNNLTLQESVSNFNESSRYIAIDNNTIWVSHPYHGIFSIEQNETGSFKNTNYNSKNGLPSDLNNHVFKVKDKIFFATLKGIFTFNKAKEIFEPLVEYNNLLDNKSIRYLKDDSLGNIWFINEKNIGVIDNSQLKPSVTYFPELTNKLLSGFEFIYPYNESNVFIGGAKGLHHLNYEKYKKSTTTLPISIRKVEIFYNGDSTLFGGYALDSIKETPTLHYKFKTIRFQFSSPIFGMQNILEYSYRLKGYDKKWSDWSNRTEKEYTNLPSGSFVFEVKVKNNLGAESEIASYTFNVSPPWYKSIWAYLFYALIFAAALYLLYNWQKNKFINQQKNYEKEQEKLLYVLDLERAKRESEVIALQNEKLEADLNYQNSELATSAMHLVKKSELLTKIKSELQQVTKTIENKQALTEVKKITKALNQDENMDKDWEHFAKHFDKVHSDFLMRLKEIHPTITPSELKLSAYLRMNLSTKEIAQLLNISVRGVEISRYRLRKKLTIATEISLFDYLIKIQPNK